MHSISTVSVCFKYIETTYFSYMSYKITALVISKPSHNAGVRIPEKGMLCKYALVKINTQLREVQFCTLLQVPTRLYGDSRNILGTQSIF